MENEYIVVPLGHFEMLLEKETRLSLLVRAILADASLSYDKSTLRVDYNATDFLTVLKAIEPLSYFARLTELQMEEKSDDQDD